MFPSLESADDLNLCLCHLSFLIDSLTHSVHVWPVSFWSSHRVMIDSSSVDRAVVYKPQGKSVPATSGYIVLSLDKTPKSCSNADMYCLAAVQQLFPQWDKYSTLLLKSTTNHFTVTASAMTSCL